MRPAQGTAARAMASVRPQKRLRQAITSPMEVWMWRVPAEPTASAALSISPVTKSSFTARRVQPWSIARGKNPECWKNVFDLPTSS